MITRLFAGVLVLATVGCTGPSLASRMIGGDTSRFVRLDTFADSRATADLRFAHPAELSEAELTAILSRIQAQERVGLLEQKPFPQPIFSPTEIKHLVPSLRKALQAAKPTEWVAFYSAAPGSAIQEITSGGLFVKNNQLHVVVANFHEKVSPGSGSFAAIRANPISPSSGKSYALSFDPQRFVASVQTTWIGGATSSPASELVLDHSAFLAEALPVATSGVAAAAAQQASPLTTPPAPIPLPMATQRETAAENAKTRDQVTGLQDEVARLRKRLEEQDDELAQLKTRLIELDALVKSQSKKKSAR